MEEGNPKCEYCKEEFEDGDLLARTNIGDYPIRISLNPLDRRMEDFCICYYRASRDNLGDLKFSYNLKMYHKGKTYYLDRLREFLLVKKKVSLTNNSKFNLNSYRYDVIGERLVGDLEGLIEPLPEGQLPSFI